MASPELNGHPDISSNPWIYDTDIYFKRELNNRVKVLQMTFNSTNKNTLHSIACFPFISRGLHYDPELWPDPERFDPTRHLNDQGEVVKSPYLIPFGAGKLRYLYIYVMQGNTLVNYLGNYNWLYSAEKWLRDGDYRPGNRSKQFQETHTIYAANFEWKTACMHHFIHSKCCRGDNLDYHNPFSDELRPSLAM